MPRVERSLGKGAIMIRAALVSIAGLVLLAAAAPDAGSLVGQRLAEVRTFAKAEGDTLWPGYGDAPFGFLLVAGESETLLCSAGVPDGFSPAADDPASGCKMYTRPRSGLPDTLLAALPLFGPPSTIVMGTPETTGRNEADWTRTILHEHFHQWQDSFPNIFTRMAGLDLAGDDKTGMWMLNFAFPYETPATLEAFAPAAEALKQAVAARGTPGFGKSLLRYVAARRAFAAAAGERNWRYAELELWKEGVARWTEIQLGKSYPDPAVRDSAEALEKRSIDWLATHDIAKAGREFVYPYGAAEAMLLEACSPEWRSEYSKHLALGPLLDEAVKRCGAR
jgi:hypothetical protein